jgi:hypothetical protein
MRLPIEPSGGSDGSPGFAFVCHDTSASVNSPSTGTPDGHLVSDTDQGESDIKLADGFR